MSEGIYEAMVINNLNEMAPLFSLNQREFLKAVDFARRLGWQSAKPSSIALAIIRLIKPEISNKTFYKVGKIEYKTLKKWTILCAHDLHVGQPYF